jgi:hypothetical protein
MDPTGFAVPRESKGGRGERLGAREGSHRSCKERLGGHANDGKRKEETIFFAAWPRPGAEGYMAIYKYAILVK